MNNFIIKLSSWIQDNLASSFFIISGGFTVLFSFVASLYAAKNSLPVLEFVTGIATAIPLWIAWFGFVVVIIVVVFLLPVFTLYNAPIECQPNETEPKKRVILSIQMLLMPVAAYSATIIWIYREYYNIFGVAILSVFAVSCILMFFIFIIIYGKPSIGLKVISYYGATSYLSMLVMLLLIASPAGVYSEKSTVYGLLTQLEEIAGSAASISALLLIFVAVPGLAALLVAGWACNRKSRLLLPIAAALFFLFVYPGGIEILGASLRSIKAGNGTPIIITMESQKACAYETVFPASKNKCGDDRLVLSHPLLAELISGSSVIVKAPGQGKEFIAFRRADIHSVIYIGSGAGASSSGKAAEQSSATPEDNHGASM